MEVVINNVCGAWSPPITDRIKDAVRLSCTKRKGHGGNHSTAIEWDEDADQLSLDLDDE